MTVAMEDPVVAVQSSGGWSESDARKPVRRSAAPKKPAAVKAEPGQGSSGDSGGGSSRNHRGGKKKMIWGREEPKKKGAGSSGFNQGGSDPGQDKVGPNPNKPKSVFRPTQF